MTEWAKCDELFRSPMFLARSARNKVNRSRQKYSSLQGSKSIVATRHANRDPMTQEWPRVMDTWKSMHTRMAESGEERVSLDAEQDYVAMVNEKETQTQQASGSEKKVDEHDVIREVLGERQGHFRGIGRKVRGVSKSPGFSNSAAEHRFDQSTTEVAELRNTVTTLGSQLATALATIDNFNAMFAELSNFVPGFQMRPQPRVEDQPRDQPRVEDQPPTSDDLDEFLGDP